MRENISRGGRYQRARRLGSVENRQSWATTPAVRAVMQGNRSRDTRPELALRSAVHALGLRYRVNQRPIRELRRTADLVFRRAKVAVYLDGCWWHGCPEHLRPATANQSFWRDKLAANIRRDRDTDAHLQAAGWVGLRIWEHEPVEAAAQFVAETVRARRLAASFRPSSGTRPQASRGGYSTGIH